MSIQDPRSIDASLTSRMRQLRSESTVARKSLSEALVEMLGREAAEKMIMELGGARIWIPVRSTPRARITQLLGDPTAAALCARFGGDYLQVPNTFAGNDIHRRIAELHRQGCKIDDIALAVGRSRRTVFRSLRRKITDLHRQRCFNNHSDTRQRSV